MSPRSDGILCNNCDIQVDKLYWRCDECYSCFCSTYCIQEMLEEHREECSGEIRQVKKKNGVRQDIPCRFFQLGKCKNGDSCPFIHDKKQIVCEYYMHGECKFGDKCVFLHSDSYAQKLKKPPRLEEKEKKVTEKKICAHFQKGMCIYGDACFKLHVIQNKSSNNNNSSPSKKTHKMVYVNNNLKNNINPKITQQTVAKSGPAGDRKNIPKLCENLPTSQTKQFMPSNTFNVQLSMEDDNEIFLSDTSSEDEETEEIQYKKNVKTAYTNNSINIPPRFAAAVAAKEQVAKNVPIKKQPIPPPIIKKEIVNNNTKEPKKETKKEVKQKPKQKQKDDKNKNIFALLQAPDDSESSDSEYSSDTETVTPTVSPPPRQLTKKEKKLLEKEQKAEDKKVIVDNLRREGNRVFQDGNANKAIELYTKAIMKAGPNNPCYKLYNNRAAAFLKMSNYRNAYRDATKCLELDTDNIKALRRLVQCTIKLGMINEARDQVKKLIILDKSWKSEGEANPKLHQNKVNEVDKLKKEAMKFFVKDAFAISETSVDKIIKICSASAMFSMMKASLAALQNKLEDAKKLLEKADPKDPNLKCGWYHFAQGLVYYNENDLVRATSKFELAASDISKAGIWHTKANQLHTSFQYAKRQVQEKNYDEALNCFANGLNLGEENKKFKLAVHCERINIFVTTNDLDEAIKEIEKAMKVDPNYSKLYVERGKIYRTKKMYKEAVKDLKKGYDLEEDKENARKIVTLIDHVQWLQDNEQRKIKKDKEEKEKKERQERDEKERAARQEQRKKDHAKKIKDFEATCHYKVLGVDKSADHRTIKQVFYEKARLFHPDKHAAATPEERKKMEEKMKEITRAHDVLSDTVKKRQYDRKMEILHNSCPSDSEDDRCYHSDESSDDECYDFSAEMFFMFMQQFYSSNSHRSFCHMFR